MPSSERPTFSTRAKVIHGILAVVTFGLWLVVVLVIWLWRTGNTGNRVVATSVAFVAVGLVILIAVSPNPERTTASQTTPTQTETVSSDTSSSQCSRFGENVDGYDILQPGASRGEYLTLLHKLQRDCPAEAEQSGLTSDFLPQCQGLDQEGCTMYQKP